MSVNKRIQKVLGILLVLCMLLQIVPVMAFAAGDDLGEQQAEISMTFAPDADLPENDELFAYYVDSKLYGYEIATFGTRARERLNAAEQGLYDALKPKIEAVALSGGSTVFTLSEVSGLKTSWSNTELGVTQITGDNVRDVVKKAVDAQFNLDKLMGALRDDCPFDMYWFDKTEGGGMGYSISYYSTQASISNLTFSFEVVAGYQGGDNLTVTTDVSKVTAAREEAQRVVAANASKSDYEKLVAYRDYIFNAVSYNDEAASKNYTGGYGDPWQLIYVFDKDSTTNVVCEGYSKAFQYLCDLGGLDCISVGGDLGSASGTGGHMWNVVTLNNKNYLVDVTNCDAGTVGAPDKLFLVGGTYETDGYYYTIGGQTVWFVCDDLSLAAENYTPGQEVQLKGDLDSDWDVDAEDLTILARHVAGIEVLTDAAALKNANVDGSCEITAEDLTLHARYVAGIITNWDQE